MAIAIGSGSLRLDAISLPKTSYTEEQLDYWSLTVARGGVVAKSLKAREPMRAGTRISN
jgi:hypothetical protein